MVVVDYGIGNVFSVCRAIEQAGGQPILSGDPDVILAADRLILPGVGAYGRAADELARLGLDQTVKSFAATERPFLGLCVGMQLLLDASSEFGNHKGLGLIRGRVKRIPSEGASGALIRVPHIGWSELAVPEGSAGTQWRETPLADTIPGVTAFYFVHSYAAHPEDRESTVAEVDYGGLRLTAAITSGSITGLQFHPERSGEAGQRVLRRFLDG